MKTFKELKAQINEASFSKSQLDKLRKEYSGKKKIDTSSKEFQAVVKSFRKLPDNVLKQIRDAKIDHISFLAANIIDEKKRGKGNKYFPGSTTESVDLEEAVSMKNAKGIGFGKRGGYGKYVTLAKKKNAKSYKDVLKVLSREGLGKEELDNVADYVMNALGESVEIELEEDYFSVQYYNGNKNAVDDKFKTFKSKAEADKYAKRGNAVDRVGGEYKVFKVKGRMESVEESKPAGYGNTDVKVGDEFEKNKLTLKVIAVSGKKVTVKKKGKKQSLMPITQFDTWTKINESVETDLDSLFEEELREDYFNVQYYNGNKNAVDDKFKNFKTKAEADKYAKRGNSIDRVGGEYKVFKVKGRMESVEEAVSMKNAKGIGFGKKGGYDKYVTLAKKKNAKSHKDVLKVLSREGLGKEELDNVADYVMNALGESVDLDEAVLGGIKKALTSLAKKPEYKKIANALNGLADFGQGSEKKQATAIKNRLTQLARNVGKKESAKLMKIAGLTATYESVDLEEAKGSDCTIQNDGRNNIAVCIDGLSFADARKGTRGSMMNITDFKKKAKVAYADAKGKPTLPAVKKEIKALGAKNFYAKWQADSSSYKDDSVQIWFTK
jgi:dsDNA-binding SOS-regulon protein